MFLLFLWNSKRTMIPTTTSISSLLPLISVLKSKFNPKKIIASYGISTADRNTIKKIAGKIIPAISTTTAFVTGTISLELFKIECGLNVIEKYRSCFANLSMPMFCFTEPGPCSKFTFCKKEYTLWDHLVLKKSEDLQTIGDLVSKLEELIGGEVSMVTAGSVSLYIGFGLPVGLHS